MPAAPLFFQIADSKLCAAESGLYDSQDAEIIYPSLVGTGFVLVRTSREVNVGEQMLRTGYPATFFTPSK